MQFQPLHSLKKRFSRSFLKESSGNVAMITALAILPIIGVAGLAVDFQLVVTKKNTVQQTLDATMIAAARERQEGASPSEIALLVDRDFHTLLAVNDAKLECGTVSTSSPEGSEQINASVDCVSPTTLSAIFGRDQFDFVVQSGSTFGIGEVDVAFVFDLSGSMNNNGRLAALRAAADDATEILLAAGNSSNNSASQSSVRIAIASYNHSVNAGPFFDEVVEFNRRPATLELSEAAGELYPENNGVVQIDSRDNRRFFDYETVRCTSGSNSNCSNYTDYAGRFYPDEETNCVYARLGDDALTDRDPSDGRYLQSDQPLWDYLDNFNESNRRDEFNAKRRGQDELENDAPGQYRDGGEGLTNPPLRNTNANDLNFNSGSPNGPSSYGRNRNNQGGSNFRAENNALTYHIRLRDDVPGQSSRDVISTNRRLNDCHLTGEPLPLTDSESALKNYTRDMRAQGATAGHLGIAWGWYLLSPRWSGIWPNSSEPLDYFAEDTAKAMIIMTDGVFNSTHPNTPKNSNETAADYCRAIKAETNIQIYTIGFDVPTRTETVDGEEIQVPNLPLVEGTDQNILQFCASNDESAFDASGEEELREAYSQIAVEISDLRLAK